MLRSYNIDINIDIIVDGSLGRDLRDIRIARRAS